MKKGEVWKSKISILKVKISNIGDWAGETDKVVVLTVVKTSDDGFFGWSNPSGISLDNLPAGYMFQMQRKEFIKAFDKVYDESR